MPAVPGGEADPRVQGTGTDTDPSRTHDRVARRDRSWPGAARLLLRRGRQRSGHWTQGWPEHSKG